MDWGTNSPVKVDRSVGGLGPKSHDNLGDKLARRPNYQIIGREVFHFDDKEVAREALASSAV